MAFVPISNDIIKYGIAGDADPYDAQMANCDELYGEYRCPVVSSFGTFGSTTSTALVDVHRWYLRNNRDNNPLKVSVWMQTSNASHAATVRINVKNQDGGGTDYVELTTTSTVAVLVEGTISTFTNSGTGESISGQNSTVREMTLQAKIANASASAHIHGVYVEILPSAPATDSAAFASGFRKCVTTPYGTDPAISTDRLSRGLNAPILICRDRPRTLFSICDSLMPAVASRVLYVNTSVPTVAFRGHMVVPDAMSRNYVFDAYVESGGSTSVQIEVFIAKKKVISTSGQGHINGVFLMAGGAAAPTLQSVEIRLYDSTSRAAHLHCMQIRRHA